MYLSIKRFLILRGPKACGALCPMGKLALGAAQESADEGRQNGSAYLTANNLGKVFDFPGHEFVFVVVYLVKLVCRLLSDVFLGQ